MPLPKNILVFHRSFFEISETFVYEQIQALSRRHKISLLAYYYPNNDKFPLANNTYQIKVYENFTDKVLSKIAERLSLGNTLMSVLNRSITKSLIRKQKFEIIHAHFGTNAVAILPVAKALNIPLIPTFHGIDASPAMLKNNQYSKHLPELFDYASKIVIVSPHMIDTLNLTKYMNKVELIPCGVDFNLFTRNGQRPSNRDQIIRILHSGRLVEKKGVPDLIRVFANLCQKYNNIRLTVIGGGPEGPTCEQEVEKTGLGDKISLLGPRPHAEVIKYMNESDIFVLNARTSKRGDMEGTPVSIQEAMSMELPVISTYHAGIPHVITDRENGLLVAENDNTKLSDALESLFNNEHLRITLGQRARQRIISQFGIDLNRQRIAKLFE